MNWTAISVFVSLFAMVTVLGFVAARWHAAGLDRLEEWGWPGADLARSSPGSCLEATCIPHTR